MKRKKKGQYSKAMVAIIIILNSIFSAGVLYVFCKTSAEPSALIASWFAFTTGELWMLSSIKKTKVSQTSDDASEDSPVTKVTDTINKVVDAVQDAAGKE
jgi:hypothetical protein